MMKVYIFRHAQKDVDFTGDPDLTSSGHEQAEKLLNKVIKNELPTPTLLWSSPKKRTFSTFAPLANHLNIKIHAHADLHEQLRGENLNQFRQRIGKVLDAASEQKNQIIFICTHYDWLAEMVSVVNSDLDMGHPSLASWSPAQHIGFDVEEDGFFRFIEISTIKER